jgi:hypothetical protein
MCDSLDRYEDSEPEDVVNNDDEDSEADSEDPEEDEEEVEGMYIICGIYILGAFRITLFA